MAANLNLVWNVVRNDVKNVGVLKTLLDVAYRVINHFLFFRLLSCVIIDSVDPHYLGANCIYECMFLSADLLHAFSGNKEYELLEEFVRESLWKGDECYGILDGNTLASYGWYSNKPTRVTFGLTEGAAADLYVHYNSNYIYMYNGFTHNNYRGQRLHAIGMTRSLENYLERGFKGIVSYVEFNNFASLRSCYRMGYKEFGKIYILKIFGRHIIGHSNGCKKHGFRVEAVRPSSSK